MADTKGFDKAIAKLKGVGRRALNPREALQAIGKEAKAAHVRYYKGTAGLIIPGGGPPGEPWPALDDKTITRKLKKGKRRKLVDKGTLWQSYVFNVAGNAVRLLNEARHAFFLQKSGIGKAKKKFIVVATDLKKQDPALFKKIKYMTGRFLRTGKS